MTETVAALEGTGRQRNYKKKGKGLKAKKWRNRGGTEGEGGGDGARAPRIK